MIINITDSLRHESASRVVEFSEVFEDLKENDLDVKFVGLVEFEGILTNTGGVFKLSGRLKTKYESKCFRCLEVINRLLDISINETFMNSLDQDVVDSYTYEGNMIDLNKAIVDNVLLNLPMRQLCKQECKGLCPKCGIDLNNQVCCCSKEETNPKMDVLKNYFKN